jgi:hypothetical protein
MKVKRLRDLRGFVGRRYGRFRVRVEMTDESERGGEI